MHRPRARPNPSQKREGVCGARGRHHRHLEALRGRAAPLFNLPWRPRLRADGLTLDISQGPALVEMAAVFGPEHPVTSRLRGVALLQAQGLPRAWHPVRQTPGVQVQPRPLANILQTETVDQLDSSRADEQADPLLFPVPPQLLPHCVRSPIALVLVLRVRPVGVLIFFPPREHAHSAAHAETLPSASVRVHCDKRFTLVGVNRGAVLRGGDRHRGAAPSGPPWRPAASGARHAHSGDRAQSRQGNRRVAPCRRRRRPTGGDVRVHICVRPNAEALHCASAQSAWGSDEAALQLRARGAEQDHEKQCHRCPRHVAAKL
mmetsp:Transcript_54436/g.151642  ORF Transcript_54436/g.151642 Transcript_54436/m.151642 type:complete len:318 (-) Transcript_54436:72-1025(-)